MGIHATGWRVDPAETPANYCRQLDTLRDLRDLRTLAYQTFAKAREIDEAGDVDNSGIIQQMEDVLCDALAKVEAYEGATVEYEARDEPTPGQMKAWHEGRVI